MKYWLTALALVGLVGTILAACGPKGETGITTPAAPRSYTIYGNEKPEYGGKVTFAVGQIGGFDPANSLALSPSCMICFDGLVCEDWTKGPTGSGLTSLASNYTPPEYFGGWLAESWKVPDTQTITFFLRKGVHYMNKPPVNGREFTADDVVNSLDFYRASQRSGWYRTRIEAKIIDKYTVTFTLPSPTPYVLETGYNDFFIVAQEVVNFYADLSDWHTVISTGPYSVQDVVPGTSILYTRNKDYWQVDPFRPENHLPYVGTLEAIVVTDVNIQMAALQSGRIDRMAMTKTQADRIQKTNPGMQFRRLPPVMTNILHMRTDLKSGPYADIRVRQALSMAIDRETISNEIYAGDAVLLNWPFQTTAGPQLYTPLQALPPDLYELYGYYPDKSKKLLAEAGFPKGFKATINVYEGYAGGTELYSYVEKYFNGIGVQTTLAVSGDYSGYFGTLIRHTYTDMSTSAWGNGHPSGALAANTCGYAYNYSVVCDQFVEQERQAINTIADETVRFDRLRKLGYYLIEQQYYIELPSPYSYIFWQPWLKGQSGEVVHGSLNNWFGYLKFCWTDSKVKASQTTAK